MIPAMQRSLERWLPMFEYTLGGSWMSVISSLLLLAASWYIVTECWLGQIVGFWYPSFEYFFLGSLPIASLWRGCYLRWELDEQRKKPHLHLVHPTPHGELESDRLTTEQWADLFTHAASNAASRRLRAFYKWMSTDVRGGDPTAVTLQEFYCCWYRRRTWVRSLTILGAMVFLASPCQYLLGHFMASGLDRLVPAEGHILGGKLCLDLGSTRSCTSMQQTPWPGALELKGDAPDAGRFRLAVHNWPRSGRTLQFRSEPLYVNDQVYSGNEVTLPVRGRVADFSYIVSGPGEWSLWADLKYCPWTGCGCNIFSTRTEAVCSKPLQRATYSGLRTPIAVPRDRYGKPRLKPVDGGTQQ